MAADPLVEIKAVFAGRRYLFTRHALRQAEQRRITRLEVEEAVLAANAEIIEHYPGDPRGASCLILGFARAGRPLHALVSYRPVVRVVTVYEPSTEQWIDYRIRR